MGSEGTAYHRELFRAHVGITTETKLERGCQKKRDEICLTTHTDIVDMW